MAASTMMMMNIRTIISNKMIRIKSPRDVTPSNPPAFSTYQEKQKRKKKQILTTNFAPRLTPLK